MAQSFAEAFRSASIPVPVVEDEPSSQVRPRLGGPTPTGQLSPIERASGHDIHFLQRLERVASHQVELALTLYRDEELLAEVLRRAALPPSAERFAISLDDDREGPFLIVTRTGRFVTCLGHGMHIDPQTTPLVTRARLDAAASKVERMRERLASARALIERGGEDAYTAITLRLVHDWRRLSREDAELLLRLRPLVGPMTMELFTGALRAQADSTRLAEQLRLDRLRASDEALFMHLDRLSFVSAQLAPLVDHDVFLDAPATPRQPNALWTLARCVMEGGTYLHFARALWLVARHARRLVGDAKDDTTRSMAQVYARELGLGVMQLASSRVRAEAHKAGASERSPAPWLGTVDDAPRMHRVACAMAQLVRSATAQPAELDRVACALGRRDAEGRGITAASDDVARAMLWNDADHALGDEDALTRLAVMLPGLARASETDLYLPAAVVRRLPRAAPTTAFAAQAKALALLITRRPEVTVARATKPGRNDACSCGSGKKYKRCCGRVH